ncbi:MAG TPA: flagellar biosynthesis protein FlhA [Thermomicrobiales bacterium]|nr:flagellar biosynthesis protein FlhA [Thermomicrobiales bacterium]
MIRLARYSDIILGFGVILIIVMMIIPIPTSMLDLLLAINISSGLVILMVSMYILSPLEFSSFPSVLLIATLFRLALSIASTRLILTQANAGSIIDAFGSFVIGGNIVVGMVVFAILAVIQFIVITNGATRVAEVAARFTLDALPGKQMAIDADLNAGLINEDQARFRREIVTREANFYGAMDGASKFVRGDAIAGIIIIFINLIGGIAIGMLQQGLSFSESLNTFARLTVGDGLVSQIPALLISTATGVIVTRSVSDTNLGANITGQILSSYRALALGGTIVMLFGIAPGLPTVPFMVIGIGLVGLAFVLWRQQREGPPEPEAMEPAGPQPTPEEDLAQLLQVDPMELEIGYSLIPLVDENSPSNLLRRITLIRRQIAMDLGIIVPSIRIHDNLELQPNEYRIKIRDVEVGSGTLYPDRLMAMDPGTVTETVDGIMGVEPAFGLPAVWIQPGDRELADRRGYTIVDPGSVIATHLTEVIRTHAAELLTRQDVQSLLDSVRAEHPTVVEELIPNLLSVGEIQQVLRNLLREGVSIRDLVTILETLGNAARQHRDLNQLTEQVRQALAASISRRMAEPDGNLYVMTLSPDISQSLMGSVQQTESGPALFLDPETLQRTLQSIGEQAEAMAGQGHRPILLTPGNIRAALRRLIERSLPNVSVLSFQEISPQVDVHSVGMVGSSS